jgi:hypothetical protein
VVDDGKDLAGIEKSGEVDGGGENSFSPVNLVWFLIYRKTAQNYTYEI